MDNLNKSIEIEVSTKNIDVAKEKVRRLHAMLDEAQAKIDTLTIQQQKAIAGSKNGPVRRLFIKLFYKLLFRTEAKETQLWLMIYHGYWASLIEENIDAVTAAEANFASVAEQNAYLQGYARAKNDIREVLYK